MTTMMLQSVIPVFKTVFKLVLLRVKRRYDQKGTGSVFVTRQTTMSGYKGVYKGDYYLTYIKFSYALNIAFTSMMYGIGMPILFPLGAAVLIVQMICERLTLA